MNELKPEQLAAAKWLASRTEAFVWLPLGFGKTIVTLTAFEEMRRVYCQDWRAVVFSTKAIVDLTWGQEIRDWGLDLSYASAAGRDRAAVEAGPDVLGVNFENVCWYLDLVDRGEAALPEVLIVDESSKLKDPSAQRTRRLIGQRRRNDPPGWERGYVHRFKRRIALSATPAPEGYQGLWSQEASISPRRRLGLNISQFRSLFCTSTWNGVANDYHVSKEGEERIEAILQPITYTVKAGNFLDLPEPTHVEVKIPWAPAALAQYEELEAEMALKLEGEGDLELDDLDLDSDEIAASNAAVLLNKLRQVCSGFAYDEDREPRWLEDGDAKIDALATLLDRAGDSSVVVFAQFIASAERIAERFPGAHVGLPDTLDDWNAGRIPILVLHPRSAGHGINLQHGSSQIVFYELPWSREEYQQAIGRLHRRGQKQPVTVHRLMRPASVEGDVWAKLRSKGMKLSQLLERVGHRGLDATA